MTQNNPFEAVRNIVVIKLRHIGDVLLTVPVFRALREHFPEARIAALVNSGTEEVITGNPLVDEIVLFDRTIKRRNPAQRYLCELSFLRQLRQHHFDMSVSLTSGDRSAVIAYFSGARYRLAYDPGRKGLFGKRYLYTHLAKLRKRGQHSVIKNLDVIAQFGISTDDLSVDFHIPEEARTSIGRILAERGVSETDRIVHVHPTSRWLFKCWKDSFMAEVIRWLTDRGMKVIVTSSPDKGELERVKAILSLCNLKEKLSQNHLVDLSGKITIKQLAAVTQRSVLFFGVDTAPMHIAAAVGTPVVALFGAGQQNWRPWGEGHCIISSESLPRQSLGREEWVKRNLERITPQDVVAELERRLSLTQGES
ncbi:MAG TPA: putative lipopolysaccharide heptosyltransferase III [Dissulfurispiraceae bacterium]|nr:putative lipopolysaccharide heptosyltransferase III [Dissulfurispiraceae bacterium]